MEKSKSGSAQQTKSNQAAGKENAASKSSNGSKSKKTSVAKIDTSEGATSKVKSKVGHGMANEGTNGTYEESDR